MSVDITKVFVEEEQLLCVFRCEHCDHVNAGIQTVVGSANVDAGFKLFGPRRAEREAQAKSSAAIRAKEKKTQMCKDVSEGNYAAARLGCRCSKCKRKPVWARIYSPALENAFNVFAVVTVMLFAFSLLALIDNGLKEWLLALLGIVLVPAAVTLGLWIAQKVRLAVNSKKASEMRDRYKPVLCSTVSEFFEVYSKMKGTYNIKH